MELIQFENTSALDMSLSSEVSERLNNAIQKQGKASLILSGGRTPLGFFHQLSKQVLDWSKVTVTLADERWVKNDHKDSNEKLVKENLLINEAHCAKFLSLKNDFDTAVAGEAQLEKELAEYGQFTVVILGMGDDGHTASLFPCSDELPVGMDLNTMSNLVAITPKTAPYERISLTAKSIFNAKKVILHLNGSAKLHTLEEAMNLSDSSQMPIYAFLQHGLDIFWSP